MNLILRLLSLVLVFSNCAVTSLFPNSRCAQRWKFYNTLDGCGLEGVCRMCDTRTSPAYIIEQDCKSNHRNDHQLYGEHRARWCSKGVIPTCDFPAIANGHTTCKGELNDGKKDPLKMFPDSECFFTCDRGFKLVGSESVKCEDKPRQPLTVTAALPRCIADESQTTVAGHDNSLTEISTGSDVDRGQNAVVTELTKGITLDAEIPGPGSTTSDGWADGANNPRLKTNESDLSVNPKLFPAQDRDNRTGSVPVVGIILGSLGGVVLVIVVALLIYCKRRTTSDSKNCIERAEEGSLNCGTTSVDTSISSDASCHKGCSSDCPLIDHKVNMVDRNIISDKRPSTLCTGHTGVQQNELRQHASGQSCEVLQQTLPSPRCKQTKGSASTDGGAQEPHLNNEDVHKLDFVLMNNIEIDYDRNHQCRSSSLLDVRVPPVGESAQL